MATRMSGRSSWETSTARRSGFSVPPLRGKFSKWVLAHPARSKHATSHGVLLRILLLLLLSLAASLGCSAGRRGRRGRGGARAGRGEGDDHGLHERGAGQRDVLVGRLITRPRQGD